MEIVKFIFKTAAILVAVFLLYFNYSLYRTDNPNFEKQKNHLKRIIHEENAATKMQEIFPEGFVFMNALYGLIWCDYLLQNPDFPDTAAFREIDFSLQQLESEEATRIFNADLQLPNGAFYNGWLHFLRGQRLACDWPKSHDPILVQKFQEGCAIISLAWQNDGGPYLESYPGQTWPADNILCLASLSLHDRLFEPRYQSVIKAWISKIEGHLDPKTGLIPHSYLHASNEILEGGRGSSQSLMLCFLPGIDSLFAKRQFLIFKANFLDDCLGLPGIREFPKGQTGQGDIDSGPVVLGFGGAASIVGIRAFSSSATGENCETRNAIRSVVQSLLFPIEFNKEKKFLAGQLPILDAFLTWSYSSENFKPCNSGDNWRWKFQLISLALLLPLLFWLPKKGRKK